MITMCDLMDQFPNFIFRNQTYIISKNFPPDLLKFSILRFYNDEKKISLFLSLSSDSIVIGLNRFIVLNVQQYLGAF